MDVNLQYFLRKSDLPALHRRFDVFYEDVMENSAIDAVKVGLLTEIKGLGQKPGKHQNICN